MKLTVYKPVEVEAAAIRVRIPLQHWNDDGPPENFPLCSEPVWSKTDISRGRRQGRWWDAVIDLDTGRIRNWPEGYGTADIHEKVRDQGIYELLAADGSILATLDDYVPSCIPGEYGDYVIFDIANDGTVVQWRRYCDPDSVQESFFTEDDD